MKKILLFVIAVSVLGTAAAAAEKIVYVNTQMLFDKTKLGQKYQGIVRDYFNNRKKIIDADRDEIQKLRDDYEKQKSVMNEKARKEKETMINQKIADLEKKAMEFNQEVGKKNDELSREFDQNLMAVLKDIAKKEKLSLVFNKTISLGPQGESPVILYAEEGLDITDKVIAEMDKKFETK